LWITKSSRGRASNRVRTRTSSTSGSLTRSHKAPFHPPYLFPCLDLANPSRCLPSSSRRSMVLKSLQRTRRSSFTAGVGNAARPRRTKRSSEGIQMSKIILVRGSIGLRRSRNARMRTNGMTTTRMVPEMRYTKCLHLQFAQSSFIQQIYLAVRHILKRSGYTCRNTGEHQELA